MNYAKILPYITYETKKFAVFKIAFDNFCHGIVAWFSKN